MREVCANIERTGTESSMASARAYRLVRETENMLADRCGALESRLRPDVYSRYVELGSRLKSSPHSLSGLCPPPFAVH